MPWTSEDADRHKKGLSARQKEVWARVANQALEACLKKGKDRKWCEGYAIRVANAVAARVSKEDTAETLVARLDTRQLHEIRGEIRTDTIRYDENTGVLTAEVIISKEAVLPYVGPNGEVIYEYIPGEELRRQEFLDSCQGKPVTDGHPPTQMITMENLSKYAKGALHGPFQAIDTDDGVIVVGRETIWDPDLIREILAGRKRQVSIGRWAVVRAQPGEWKGKRYDAVQTNLIANHLAHTDHGRQKDECRILLDEAEALEEQEAKYLAELDKLYDKPLSEIVPGIKSIIERAAKEAPLALAAIVEWVEELRSRVEKALKLEREASDLAQLLRDLEELFPEEQEPANGGDQMSEVEVLDVAGEKIEVPGEAWRALDQRLKESLVRGLMNVVARVKAEVDAAQERAKNAEAVAQALRDEFQAMKEKWLQMPSAAALADEVEERARLLEAIRMFDPHYNHRGVPTDQMKRDLLARAYPDMKTKATARGDDGQYILPDAYVQARVDLLLEQIEQRKGAPVGPALLKPMPAEGSEIAKKRAARLALYNKKAGGEA